MLSSQLLYTLLSHVCCTTFLLTDVYDILTEDVERSYVPRRTKRLFYQNNSSYEVIRQRRIISFTEFDGTVQEFSCTKLYFSSLNHWIYVVYLNARLGQSSKFVIRRGYKPFLKKVMKKITCCNFIDLFVFVFIRFFSQ